MNPLMALLIHITGWLWLVQNWGEGDVLVGALFFGLAYLIWAQDD